MESATHASSDIRRCPPGKARKNDASKSWAVSMSSSSRNRWTKTKKQRSHEFWSADQDVVAPSKMYDSQVISAVHKVWRSEPKTFLKKYRSWFMLIGPLCNSEVSNLNDTQMRFHSDASTSKFKHRCHLLPDLSQKWARWSWQAIKERTCNNTWPKWIYPKSPHL